MDFEISMLSGDKIAEDLALIQAEYPLSIREQADHTIQHVLSSLKQLQTSADSTLSGVPVHPYEKMKWEYLEPNYTPPSLADVQVPDSFSLSTVYASLTAFGKTMTDNTMTALMSLSSGTVVDPNAIHAFAVLSGDAFVVDKDLSRGHLQFLEFAKNIPLDAVNQNPLETAQKVLTLFSQTYLQR